MLIYYIISIYLLMMSFLFFYLSLFFLLMNYSIYLNWNILNLNSVELNALIYLDWISMLFIFTVILISSMILFYSIEYMNNDLNYKSFFFLMLLFILSMIFMVISPNLISILLGWDGLGLISYCLVIFYQNKYSYSSGNLTIFSNRIGDITLIMAISLMFSMSSWNFLNFYLNKDYLIFIFLIIVTSFTKSAQFPFSAWLPVAMAAPTPVSSLVHSSTLVTAGIYLLIRFKNLIYKYNYFLMLILYISLITILLSSISAIFEYDFKKIIAYSTLSQLGLMMLIYSMKYSNLSYFHLIIHAMFKSMMFMCSGIFIHSLINYQDIRFMGNMKKFMPLTCLMFFISNLSLCGLPFLSGFFSKDKILETLLMSKISIFIYFMIYFSTLLTMIYSMRLTFYLMNKNFNFIKYYNIGDSKMMNFSMMILLLMSIMFGMIMNWIIFFSIEYIYLKFIEKFFILLILMMGILISYLNFKFKFFKKNYFLNYYFGSLWFFYKIIYLMMMILKLGKLNYNYLDKGWIIYMIKYNNLMNFNNINMNLIKISNNNLFNLILMINFILLIILMI